MRVYVQAEIGTDETYILAKEDSARPGVPYASDRQLASAQRRVYSPNGRYLYRAGDETVTPEADWANNGYVIFTACEEQP